MKAVLLAGQTICIKLVSPEFIQECVKEGKVDLENPDDRLHGWFEADTFTVFIDSSLRADVFRRTVIHELMHAVLELSGLTHLLSSKKEEAVCTASEQLSWLLEDKEFVEWFNH